MPYNVPGGQQICVSEGSPPLIEVKPEQHAEAVLQSAWVIQIPPFYIEPKGVVFVGILSLQAEVGYTYVPALFPSTAAGIVNKEPNKGVPGGQHMRVFVRGYEPYFNE